MNRPIFRDTSELPERQKCVLALEQAIADGHKEYRIRELRERLEHYDQGYEETVRMAAESELEEAAIRIAILEEDLHKEREKKWSAVRKLKLIEEYGTATVTLLDDGEALTLHDKIEMIKEGFVK